MTDSEPELPDGPDTENWSIKMTRTVHKWYWNFEEHWTYKVRDGEVSYKLRVVGPNGEVSREELEPESTLPEVRQAFEDKLTEASV